MPRILNEPGGCAASIFMSTLVSFSRLRGRLSTRGVLILSDILLAQRRCGALRAATTRCGNHGHLAADQIGCKCRQSIPASQCWIAAYRIYLSQPDRSWL